jgi:hypothetical protein
MFDKYSQIKIADRVQIDWPACYYDANTGTVRSADQRVVAAVMRTSMVFDSTGEETLKIHYRVWEGFQAHPDSSPNSSFEIAEEDFFDSWKN